MSIHHAFTEEQECILNEVYHWNPELMEHETMSSLREGDGEILREIQGRLKDMTLELNEKRVALPPKNKIPGYIYHEMEATALKNACVVRKGGVTDHLIMPTSNVELAINVVYKNLELARLVLKRLLEFCNERIREHEETTRNPFLGKEKLTPYKQILDLEGQINVLQMRSIIDALVNKRGTIDLSNFNKTVASRILRTIDQCMRNEDMALTIDELCNIQIRCRSSTYYWHTHEQNGRRARNNVIKVAHGPKVKTPAEIKRWIKRHDDIHSSD